MPNYQASLINQVQTILNERFQSPEMRSKPSTVLMWLLQNRNFLIPDLENLKKSETHPTKTYLKNRAARALGSQRIYNHSGAPADSSEVDIVYDTYSDTFSTSLKRPDDNIFDAATILAHEIENSLINLHEGIETDLVGFLDTNKNQVSDPASGTLKGATFNGVNFVYEIGAGDSDTYINILKSIYRQEKYRNSMIQGVMDSLLFQEQEKIANQGTGNSTNLGFQFSNVEMMESVEVDDGNYPNGIGFYAPVGTVGILDWIPPANRQGVGDIQSVLGGYTTITDPMSGLNFALHGYTERADTSASNGNAQDNETEWELSIDLSAQKAPISVANQSPIFAVAQQ